MKSAWKNQNLWLDQARPSPALAWLHNSWQRKLSPVCSLMHDLITGQNNAQMEMFHRWLLGEYKRRNSLCSFYLLRQSQSDLLIFSLPSRIHDWEHLLHRKAHGTGPLPLLQIHKSHVLVNVRPGPTVSYMSELKYMLGDTLTYQGQSKSHSHIPYHSWFTGHTSAHTP